MEWTRVYRVTSAWKQWKNSLGDTRPWHIVSSSEPHVKKEIFDKRIETCLKCPELIKITNQCKKCGCFMNAKAKLEKAVCPLKKW